MNEDSGRIDDRLDARGAQAIEAETDVGDDRVCAGN
jgi:hypothetical protein